MRVSSIVSGALGFLALAPAISSAQAQYVQISPGASSGTGAAAAKQTTGQSQSIFDQTTISASVTAGTLGIGPQADIRLGDLPFGIRLGVNTFDLSLSNVYQHRFSGSGPGYSYSAPVHVGGDLKLLNGGITEDWYPFHTGFRLSIGEYINGDRITAHATSTGTLQLNGNTYNAGQIGQINGKATVNTFTPYFGFGYEAGLFGGVIFSADAGILYEGSPQVSFTASGPIAAVPQFQSDLSTQRGRIQHDIDYPVYPVAQIGLGYKF